MLCFSRILHSNTSRPFVLWINKVGCSRSWEDRPMLFCFHRCEKRERSAHTIIINSFTAMEVVVHCRRGVPICFSPLLESAFGNCSQSVHYIHCGWNWESGSRNEVTPRLLVCHPIRARSSYWNAAWEMKTCAEVGAPQGMKTVGDRMPEPSH